MQHVLKRDGSCAWLLGILDDSRLVGALLRTTLSIGPNQAGIGSVHLLVSLNSDPQSDVVQWGGSAVREREWWVGPLQLALNDLGSGQRWGWKHLEEQLALSSWHSALNRRLWRHPWARTEQQVVAA
jgi:hypothetical protein